MSRFTSAAENSLGVRLPTTRPPITWSLDHKTTTYAATISSFSWASRKIGGSDKPWAGRNVARSEEHTSELQSLRHLVCRLLLEKKKIRPTENQQRRARTGHAAGRLARPADARTPTLHSR